MQPATPSTLRYSSSPPSSPFSSLIDSSPASSPSLEPIIVDTEEPPIHPFAASTHAGKRPPRYEKKEKLIHGASKCKLSFRTLSSSGSSKHSGEEDNSFEAFGLSPSASFGINIEQELWDMTIAHAIDTADGKIDLSEHGLTYIPSSISDLTGLVVLSQKHCSQPYAKTRVPTRVATSMITGPGRAAQRVRSLVTARTASGAVFTSSSTGSPKEEVHLYLGNNLIRCLPNELFNLSTLVVLSLRGNCLQELPPQIGQLVNLRELNVSLNKLKYLPAEIQNLHLTSLAVEPNPFFPPPPTCATNEQDVLVSKTRHTMGLIPPLTELTLRILMSPTVGQEFSPRTQLESLYELPLSSEWPLSPPIERILSSCIPNCIISAQRSSTEEMTPCVSTCSSPHHRDIKPGDHYKRPIFIAHAEETFTWEVEIAGVRVSHRGAGGRVPLRWRGCQRGCLDYLDPKSRQEQTEADMDIDADFNVLNLAAEGTNGDADVDMAGNSQFSSNGFEFDDD